MNGKPLYAEKELMQRVAQGDEQAFRILFDEYRQRIYALGFYLTHTEYLAEEIVQEVFLRIWTHRAKLTELTWFNAYLKTIARNVAMDFLRKLATERLALREMAGRPEYTGITEDNTIAREYEKFYQEAIATLSPQRRKAYLLSRQLGLKNEQVAEQMQVSVYTVK